MLARPALPVACSRATTAHSRQTIAFDAMLITCPRPSIAWPLADDRMPPAHDRMPHAPRSHAPRPTIACPTPHDRMPHDRMPPAHDRMPLADDRMPPAGDRMPPADDRMAPANDRNSRPIFHVSRGDGASHPADGCNTPPCRTYFPGQPSASATLPAWFRAPPARLTGAFCVSRALPKAQFHDQAALLAMLATPRLHLAGLRLSSA
jgi:hypothetical protein